MGNATIDTVYLLWFVPEGDEYKEQALLIGAYRSTQDCEEAIGRLKDKPGFRDYISGFEYEGYVLNRDHWGEGFVTWGEVTEEIDKPQNSD